VGPAAAAAEHALPLGPDQRPCVWVHTRRGYFGARPSPHLVPHGFEARHLHIVPGVIERYAEVPVGMHARGPDGFLGRLAAKYPD